MKRPAFQFYPEKWVGNQKLRRCSKAARGAWIDTLCALHDSDEYGLVRFPLRELADVVGAPLKLMRELVDKGVLKGSDGHCPAFVFTPRHAGKDGEPVTLIQENAGPCWYSSRFVKDEYIRTHAGASTRFKGGDDPPPSQRDGAIPSHRQGEPPSRTPSQRQGDGAMSLTLDSIKHGVEPETSTLPSKVNGGANSPSKGNNGAWWKTPQGIEAKAKTLGIAPSRGEDYEALKQRCFAAEQERNRRA